MNRQRKKIIAENAVSTIETFNLGGYEQKVLLEGKRENLPILLALHGGPGTPIPFCVGCRGLFPEITEKYILVCWDQYGCGINNAEIDDSFTIDHFVDMTVDLVKILKERFPKNKLYLFAMSWGSLLSAKAAVRIPELVNGVLVYGQILRAPMHTEETLQAILSSNAPEKVKQAAKAICARKRLERDDCMKISAYVRKYTEGYTNKKEPKSPIGRMIKGILTGPDYRLKDFTAIVKNGYMKNQSLITALSGADLRSVLDKITVPYHVIQGDTDIVTSTNMIVAYVQSCGNPKLTCEVIKDAAHMPGMNGMNAIMNALNRDA